MQETDANGIQWAFGFLPGGVGLSLHQHPAAHTDGFSPARLGLDHASFAVASRGDLDSWEEHLSAKGVTCGSIVDAPYGAALSFKDPDGIALEFFALPGG